MFSLDGHQTRPFGIDLRQTEPGSIQRHEITLAKVIVSRNKKTRPKKANKKKVKAQSPKTEKPEKATPKGIVILGGKRSKKAAVKTTTGSSGRRLKNPKIQLLDEGSVRSPEKQRKKTIKVKVETLGD